MAIGPGTYASNWDKVFSQDPGSRLVRMGEGILREYLAEHPEQPENTDAISK